MVVDLWPGGQPIENYLPLRGISRHIVGPILQSLRLLQDIICVQLPVISWYLVPKVHTDVDPSSVLFGVVLLARTLRTSGFLCRQLDDVELTTATSA